MSKLINKNDNRIEYINILTAEEIEEAQKFLLDLQKAITEFEVNLEKQFSSSTIQYRYKIGEFLENQLVKNKISSKERGYVWNEIKYLTNSNIEIANDRGKGREFYEYCYRIYKFGFEIANSLTWSQWVDVLDRSAALKDERFISWLTSLDKKPSTDSLRLLLLILNLYFEKFDMSVFQDDEVLEKYDFLYEIVKQWNQLFKKYFDGKKNNLSQARKEKLTKYKKKFITDVIELSKFSDINDLKTICEDSFKKYFVDIDTSSNFKK